MKVRVIKFERLLFILCLFGATELTASAQQYVDKYQEQTNSQQVKDAVQGAGDLVGQKWDLNQHARAPEAKPWIDWDKWTSFLRPPEKPVMVPLPPSKVPGPAPTTGKVKIFCNGYDTGVTKDVKMTPCTDPAKNPTHDPNIFSGNDGVTYYKMADPNATKTNFIDWRPM